MANKHILKLIFDRACALLGLIFLAPVLCVVWVLICVKMPGGPVLFTQMRVGKGGQLFTLHKFRTMTVMHSGSTVSVAGESRITPLGAVLRRYKIDELPELWDVLRGKMSFVGPRPDVPGYADLLQGDDRKVLLMLPGITGPASLKYRDEEQLLAKVAQRLQDGEKITADDGTQIDSVQQYNDIVIFPDKVRLNCLYLDNYSFLTDIKIILCTVLGRKMKFCGEIL